MDAIFNPGSIWEHVSIFLSGATTTGLIAHAVNTFPTPNNKYGSWLLGIIQFGVGQRVAAANTLKGMDTAAYPLAKPNNTEKELQK